MENEEISTKSISELQNERHEIFRSDELSSILHGQSFLDAIKTKGKWEDKLFPANDSSLYNEIITNNSSKSKKEVPNFVKVSNLF